MKRFLKKANRGLLLGAFALISLIIYIVVDYVSFSNEKTQIKETVENYIGGVYEALEQDDYEALNEHIKALWTGEPVITTGYFEDKESMLTLYEHIQADKPTSEYGEITYSIEEMSIKKSGPNMACVTVSFSTSMENGCNANLVEPFCSYTSCWFYTEEENDARYIYDVEYEGSIYLRKEDGEWKIAQSDVWSFDCMQYMKEGK